MSKFGSRRKKFNKNKIFRRRRVVILLIALVAFLCITLPLNIRFNSKKSVAIVTDNKTIKVPIVKAATNTNINLKQSKVNFTDTTATNVYNSDGNKIAYLTFDDGPSAENTPQILKILDKYKIKATFFILGRMAIINPDLVKKEVEDGQAIGNHTYSHDYKVLYSSTNAFISDVNKCDGVLKSIIGSKYNNKLLRFPGGSFGTSHKRFRVAIKSVGYNYIDWNDLTGDAEGHNVPVSKLLNNLKENTIGKEHVVILMHDSADKETTVQALPGVIEYLKSEGYSFNTLK